MNRPITPTTAALALAYVALAVARAIVRDVKTLWRITEPPPRENPLARTARTINGRPPR